MTGARFPTPCTLASRYGLTESEARAIIRDALRQASSRLWPLTLGVMGLSLYALGVSLSGHGMVGVSFEIAMLGLCGTQLWLAQRMAAPDIHAAARFARR